MSGLHGGQRGGVVRPGARILRAGVPMRLRRHERRLLPTAIRLLCPSPHRPLRPLDQRRQRARQLCQIGLMRRRFASVLLPTAHPFLTKRRRTAQLALHSPSLAVHLKTESRRPNRRQAVVVAGGRWRLAQQEPASAAAGLAVSGGLLRRWDAHPQGTVPSCRGIHPCRKQDDDLANPALTGSPKAPRIVRLLVLLSTKPRSSLVNQTTSFFSLSAPIRSVPR